MTKAPRFQRPTAPTAPAAAPTPTTPPMPLTNGAPAEAPAHVSTPGNALSLARNLADGLAALCGRLHAVSTALRPDSGGGVPLPTRPDDLVGTLAAGVDALGVAVQLVGEIEAKVGA
jgi:hypothetical protein